MNYSYDDSVMTPNIETLSRLPQSVQRNPPIPPPNPYAAQMPAAAAPVAAAPQNQNAIWSFLSSLFGGQGPGASQGMTGLLARGRGAPGTDTLGNPFGRYG